MATRLLNTARHASSTHLAGGCATAFWLRRYLTGQERSVLGRLSLFGSAFDATKAAAVMHGQHARTLEVAATDAMLRYLHGFGALRRLRGTDSMRPRPCYGMHPQVWNAAHGFLRVMPVTEHRVTHERFAGLMLDVGTRLTFCGMTAAARVEAAAILADEYGNLTALLILLRGAVLLADVPQGTQRTPYLVVVMQLAIALAALGQPVLAAFAAQLPGMYGK